LWNISGYYYSGKISQILGPNRADVSFDNGRAQYDQSFENIFKLKQKRKLLKVVIELRFNCIRILILNY